MVGLFVFQVAICFLGIISQLGHDLNDLINTIQSFVYT